MVCELYSSEMNLVVLLEDSACLSVRMCVYAVCTCAAKLCVSWRARDGGGERVKKISSSAY